ncbi:MAG: hypothetical protein FD189_1305 [Elusimicrobia bacterium]|nr:MAG: hypothetical protein FD154_1529 [Elusimicrobiota bacterium]KAF0155712.1 MAG: hypothetical protein FD189_1305 [Elusimicrobiota bacterium]
MEYIKLFDDLAKKAPGTPASLQNDYSGVLYLVNSQGRRAQAELCLARETAAAASGKESILPPDVQTYKTGFFYLAGELLYGNYPRENLALYTDEGLDFLLYEILWGLSEIGAYSDPGSYPEEKHKIRNLASDFKKFIALATEEEKLAALDEARKKEGFDDFIYKKIFAALDLYNERVAAFAAERKEACFFSPLEAYKELLSALERPETLKVSPDEFNGTRVIAVEDAADMEPLFQTLADKLKAAGYTVVFTSSADLRPEVKGGLDLKGFITSLDEAEYVGWKIKKLLSEKTAAEGEISVACFSRETASVLPLVFTRYGLQAAAPEPAGGSRIFRVYASAVRISLGLEPRAEDYLELFSSPVSAFRLSAGRLNQEIIIPGSRDRRTVRQLILEAGYKASVNRDNPSPVHWIGKVLENPEVTGVMTEEERKKLKNLAALPDLGGDSGFSDLLAVSLEMKECRETGLVKTMGRLALRADRALKACRKEDRDPALMASSLLSLMAETEYYPLGEERRETYKVPVLAPERMLNTSAAHIIACGLTGEADKLKKMPVPEKLAAAIGLTATDAAGRPVTYPERLRAEIYRKFEALAAAGRSGGLSVTLTYGYNNIGGDMAGMSNLVRAVKKFYGLDDNKGGAMPSLYAAHELMFEGEGARTPDAAYSVSAGPAAAAPASAESAPAAPPPDLQAKAGELSLLTLLRLREKKYRDYDPPPMGKDGLPLEIKIGVRDFAGFINCPRKFIVNIFMTAAGIREEKDHESQIPLTKGSFWHSVYEKAGADPDFYSGDKKKIFAAVCKAFDGLLAASGRDPETFQDLPLEEFKAESRRVFQVFAENEAARQAKLPGLKSVKNELKCEMDLGSIPLGPGDGAESVKIILSGRLDRLDISGKAGSMLHVWDYKTGKKIPKLSWSGRGAVFSQGSGETLQLAAYALMLSSEPARYGLPECKLGSISGANIMLDGVSNIDPGAVTKKKKTKKDAPVEEKDLFIENSGNIGGMAVELKKASGTFISFLANGELGALDWDYSPAARKEAGDPEPLYNPDCSYCNTHLCRFISLGGLKGGGNA